MIRIHNFSTNCNEYGTYFRYCVQESQNDSVDYQWSYCHVNQASGIRLDFSREFLLSQSNPIVFKGHTKEWKVSDYNNLASLHLIIFPLQGAQIRVTALNQLAPAPLCEAHANLTTDSIEIGIETAPVTYIGPTGHSSITTSFAIVCAEYWYGEDCSSWCPGENCKCDLPVPCHDDCVGVVCGENRHCVDGVNVYTCTCDQGFTGRQCDININECEGVNCSGNGSCIDGVGSFYCKCDSGYSGVLCEVATTSIASNGLGKSYLHPNIDHEG